MQAVQQGGLPGREYAEKNPSIEGEEGRRARLHQWRPLVTEGEEETSLLSPETWGPDTHRASRQEPPSSRLWLGHGSKQLHTSGRCLPAPLVQAPAGPDLMSDLGFNAAGKPMGWQRLLMRHPSASSLPPLP